MAYGNGTSAPYGFQGMGTFSSSGGYYANMINTWTIANGYGVSLFAGDLVVNAANGTITLAAAASPAIGVLMAVQYQDTSNFENQVNYYPLNVATYNTSPIIASVLTDPFVVYDGQSNSASGVPLTDRGLNSNVAAGSPVGNTRTGSSTEMFDTLATTTAANFNIIGIPVKDGNDWGIAYNSLLGRINNHTWVGTGTIGI